MGLVLGGGGEGAEGVGYVGITIAAGSHLFDIAPTGDVIEEAKNVVVIFPT
jgi:hypothetical protein